MRPEPAGGIPGSQFRILAWLQQSLYFSFGIREHRTIQTMSKHALHPLDVAVALHLVDEPERSYAGLAEDLGLSSSTVHESVARLLNAGLIRRDPERERVVNRHALLEFLEHGVKYAFPAVPGARVRGVATAHAGPVLRDAIIAEDAFVWPSADGESIGPSVEPLLPKAALLSKTQPAFYAILSAVDALRVGRARERNLAMNFLKHFIQRPQQESSSAELA